MLRPGRMRKPIQVVLTWLDGPGKPLDTWEQDTEISGGFQEGESVKVFVGLYWARW